MAYFSEGARLPRGQRDWESENFYYGARYYDPKISVWLGVDPLAQKYSWLSPYAFTANNSLNLIDPDGREVVWSSFLKKSLGSGFINKLSQTASFQSVFKRFIINHDNHFFDQKQLSNGRLGHGASAQIQRGGGIGANGFVTFIQKDYFVNGKLIADPTFLVLVILHEGIHQRKNLRIQQDGIQDYPGYDDHYKNPYFQQGQARSDLHHNQMAQFNRQELIDGMKEFDQLNSTSHSEDWYQAMSWFGLTRTESWKNFETQNPKLAAQYIQLMQDEVIKMNQARQQELQSSNNNQQP